VFFISNPPLGFSSESVLTGASDKDETGLSLSKMLKVGTHDDSTVFKVGTCDDSSLEEISLAGAGEGDVNPELSSKVLLL
jgi:hypothetical protein